MSLHADSLDMLLEEVPESFPGSYWNRDEARALVRQYRQLADLIESHFEREASS